MSSASRESVVIPGARLPVSAPVSQTRVADLPSDLKSSLEPLSVLFVTDLLEVGGAEFQLVELVHALDPARVRPRVVVLRRGGALADRLQVPCDVVGMGGPWDMRALGRLESIARREGARAIYATHIWSNLFARALRGRVRPPDPQRRLVAIASEHSYRRPIATPLLDYLRRHTAQALDCVVAVSEAQAGWLRQTLPAAEQKIEVIPNAIDPDRFRTLPSGEEARKEFGIPEHARVVVSVARLVPVKGHLTLLAAMERIEGHLILVGDGSERPKLERIVSQSSLSRRVHFAGTRADTRAILAAAQVACLASTDEAQGIALLEAMAAGLPVVATAVGGIPEVVDAGTTGLLVPARNPEALARALRQVLSDPSWARKAGEAGRERVLRLFSMQQRARTIEDLLLRLVQDACP